MCTVVLNPEIPEVVAVSEKKSNAKEVSSLLFFTKICQRFPTLSTLTFVPDRGK